MLDVAEKDKIVIRDGQIPITVEQKLVDPLGSYQIVTKEVGLCQELYLHKKFLETEVFILY